MFLLPSIFLWVASHAFGTGPNDCDRDEKGVFINPDDIGEAGCYFENEVVDCGPGFISMTMYYVDNCEPDQVGITHCYPLWEDSCGDKAAEMRKNMMDEGLEFKYDTCLLYKDYDSIVPLIVKCGTGAVETVRPSVVPTGNPSLPPTSLAPTLPPTGPPTGEPTSSPPTGTPTGNPVTSTSVPTGPPTDAITGPPTGIPTGTPTENPSNTPAPSAAETSVQKTSVPTSGDGAVSKVMAELLCVSAKNKKECKGALTKKQGKCTFKSFKSKGGRKGGSCKLKSFKDPN